VCKEGSIQACWCVVLPWVTSRVQECSSVYVSGYAKCICSCPYVMKLKKMGNLSGINLNVILKHNLTEPQIQKKSVITGLFRTPLGICYNQG
jgi:hypothetical protein